jgi:hypothetical protein
MNPKKLIRDPARVKACLKELPDHRLVALKPVKIYVPTRFNERNLATIGTEVHIVGIYGIVVEDQYYGSSTVNAMMRIEPTSIMRILIDGEEFFEFYFEAGATVISSTMLVKLDTLCYRIYDEIYAKGKVPWYLSYPQAGRLFETAKKHAGANLGQNQEVTELIGSIIARDENDRHKQYRSTVKSQEDLLRRPPVYIPMRSVQYAANNTLNKLAGSYFGEAVVSALVTPSDRTERIESLLRK